MDDWPMAHWTVTDWITCVIFVGVAAVGIRFWIAFSRLSELRKARLMFDESAPVRWGLVDVLIVGFVWVACQAVVFQILLSLHGMEAGQKLTGNLAARFGVITGIVQTVVIGLSLIVLVKRYGHDDSEFGLERKQVWPGIKAGLIAFAMWVPVVWGVQTILVSFIEYSHPSFQRINDSTGAFAVVDTWITAVLIAPVVEELLFRGVIQGWLQRIRGEARSNPDALILGGPVDESAPSKSRPLHIPAIVITSVLFGLAHWSQGPAPISLFVLSLGIGYLYQRTGSLVACIVVHMLLNAITMALFSIDLILG